MNEDTKLVSDLIDIQVKTLTMVPAQMQRPRDWLTAKHALPAWQQWKEGRE